MTPDKIETINCIDFSKNNPDFKYSSNTKLYKYSLDKVIEERCDEFDYILEEEGFEIVTREMIRVATSIYNYKVIVSRDE
jgi:hypothetical protein